MENNLQVFENEEFGAIRVRVLENGSVEINLEDAARGLGFARTANSGNQVIIWHRVKQYLYRLAMKDKSAAAEKFQDWIARVVLPNIRERGYYALPSNIPALITPNFLRQIADALDAKDTKIAALEETVDAQQNKIAALEPKANYYDVVLNCKDLVSTSKIAKDYGMSATRFNKLLHELRVQYKQGNTWLLYQNYAKRGWTSTKTHAYTGDDGEIHSAAHMYWTQEGWRGLHELLRAHGIFTLIEKRNLLAGGGNCND